MSRYEHPRLIWVNAVCTVRRSAQPEVQRVSLDSLRVRVRTVADETYDVFISYSRADGRHATETDSVQRKQVRNRNFALVVVGFLFALAVLLYENGIGGAQDYVKAREWYEKAADKGNALGMTALGLLYQNGQGGPQDYVKARELLEEAADKGDANAMTNLGLLYQNGQGVPQDYVKAREWYEKAADKGDANAMTNLGLLYQNGQGVPQGYGKAREWYEKAADKGNAFAMNNLGLLYENGQGVPQDYVEAREWYEKAADKGDANAKANLETLPIREAVAAGRYVEALHLQDALAAKVEAVETKREGKPGKETAQALTSVAWHALFAREYTKALAVSDRAHALLPDNLLIETNRAHALMFLERSEDAQALYLAHKGKPMTEQDSR